VTAGRAALARAALFAVLLAWPGAAPAGDLFPAAAHAPAAGLAPWKMGVVALKADTAFQEIAIRKGFYREQGLDAELVFQAGDIPVLRALVGGLVDVGELAPANPMAAIEKGANVKIVASFMPGLAHLLYGKDDLKAPKDLLARVVAVTEPGTFPYLLTTTVLTKYGLDPKKVDFLTVGGEADRMRAVLIGRADATVAAIEFQAHLRPGFHAIFSFKDELPQWIRFTHVTTDKVIRERSGDLLKALIAHARGIRYALANREETVALMAEMVKVDRKAVDWVYDWYARNRVMNPNGDISRENLRWMQELNVRLGRQARVLPYEQVATDEFQKKVVAALGEFRW
jgi:ABC-type nitrate/sulfonate/bicarbonate transport system substrate-binding protein